MADASGLAGEAFQLLTGAPEFAMLPRAELSRIASRAREIRVTPGELVVREGDRGDRMFLIASGSVQVVARAFDGSELVVTRLEAREFFGEQALLASDSLRNASVRAVNHCRLLVLTREDLLEAFDPESEFVRRLREAGENQKKLRQSNFREQVLRNLGVSESYRIETFKAGERVFSQGDPGDQLYLILGGSARVFHSENGEEVVLTELLPGQFFGELAILNASPRTASVIATANLEVASLDGSWFRSALSSHAQLRSMMASLQTMYMLPRRGLLTLQAGNLGTQPTLTAVHHLLDGGRVVSTRLIGVAAFTARVVGAPEATQSARYVDPNSGAIREIHLADGRIVELEAEGAWAELGDVLALLLDGIGIEDSQVATFRAHGDFRLDPSPAPEGAEIVCRCSDVTTQQIVQAIEAGCHTLEQVAAKTKATLVCGGCGPSVKELLGQEDWTAAHCETVIPLSETVRAFRIRPVSGPYRPNLAGQHLVVQARIDGHWIQRPYTVSSSPNAGGVYEITVKREPEGVFSRWLFDRLQPDLLLRISTPSGNYHLHADHATDVVCLVGGIGVTPALAMARTLAAASCPFRLHIDYSVSREDEAVCREELETLARANPRFKVRTRVTGHEGRITADDIATLAREYPTAAFYLCASQGYMTTVRQYLADASVPDDRIHIETFTVAGERPDPSIR